MNVNHQFSAELRDCLKEGITPSALIRHVVDRLGDAVSYGDLCSILEEAFCLATVRLSPSSVSGNKDHRGEILNKTLLMDIVERRPCWDLGSAQSPSSDSSWLDGLSLERLEDVGRRVRAVPFPGLSNASWSTLSQDEQEKMHVQLISSIVISQRVEVLARLAERLQKKISDLTAAEHALG